MPAALRLSVVHQTVLLLVAAVLLAVTALGGVVAWNLRSGFSDYLRLQDQAWLERFAGVAAEAVARVGLPAALDGPPGSLDDLLIAAGPVEQRPPARADPPPWRGDGRPPPGEGPPPWGPRGEPPPRGRPGEPPLPPRLPPGAQRYASRLSLVAADGRPLAGRRPRRDAELVVQPIVVHGQTVALARLEPGPPASQGVDAAFLARQYRGILLAGLALVALAVAGAVWVGRRWLRPVQEARQAAHAIALGAFDTLYGVGYRFDLPPDGPPVV